MNKITYFFVALLIMSGVTYLIRLLPLIFVKKKIKSKFICSFLYYLPYTVLATMTFPTIIFCTGHIISGIIALLGCIILAYLGKGLIAVATGGSALVLLTELVIYLVSLI